MQAMPVERSDKLIREKIDGLDSLPAGFQLPQAAGWKQIEQKLHPAKPKAFAWQYAAAAILFLIAGTFFWNRSSLQTPPVPTVAVKEKSVPAKQVAPTTNLEKSAAKVSSVITIVKKDNNPVIITALPKTDTASQSIAVIVESPVITPSISNTNSAISSISKPIIKKRLKVVHFNELGIEPEILYSRTPLKRNQLTEDNTDDLLPAQSSRPWWQTKPKTVTTVTLSDNN